MNPLAPYLWQRYAGDMEDPTPDSVDALLEEAKAWAATTQQRAAAMRVRALWVWDVQDEWKYPLRLMRKATRLGDPYARLFVAEDISMRMPVRAFWLLCHKHIPGNDPHLDRIVQGLLSGWGWDLYRSRKLGDRLPELATTTLDKLGHPLTSWAEYTGQPHVAEDVLRNAVEEGVRGALGQLAAWLLDRGREEEGLAVALAGAEAEDLVAIYRLGRFYQNEPKGIAYLRRAANMGHIDAPGVLSSLRRRRPRD